jgi:hypothetical protein
LREGGKEVTGQPGERSRAVVVDIIHLAAKVVDGVVAAKQDAVVAGDAVVMKLVGHVGNALPVLPADGRQLFCAQRLGHQHIVVHRDGVPAITLEQRRKGIGGQHHAGGIQLALRRRQSHPVAPAVQHSDRGLFVNLHTQLNGHPRQFQHQLAGVNHRRAVFSQMPDRKVGELSSARICAASI